VKGVHRAVLQRFRLRSIGRLFRKHLSASEHGRCDGATFVDLGDHYGYEVEHDCDRYQIEGDFVNSTNGARKLRMRATFPSAERPNASPLRTTRPVAISPITQIALIQWNQRVGASHTIYARYSGFGVRCIESDMGI